MKAKAILLSTNDAEVALDELVEKGLAERRGGKKWRLTYQGQTEGIEIWGRLSEAEKMLMFGMLQDLDVIKK